MYRRKFTYSLLFVLALAIMVIAACSTSAPAPARGTAADDSSVTSGEATSDEPVNLQFMFWGREDAPEIWQGVVDRFHAAGHENVNIEFIHQPLDYDTKLNTLIAAGEVPDVVLMSGPSIAKYYNDGLVVDQTPYLLEEAGISPDDYYVPVAVRRVGDGIACIANGVHTMINYYNKGVFDAAGVAYPPATQDEAWTWDQFVDTAKALTKGEGIDKTYGVYIPPWPTIWRVFVESNGGSYYNDDMTAVTLDTPEAIEAVQKMADLRLVDQVAPPVDMIDSLGWDIFLQDDRSAMFIDGSFSIPTIKEWWGDDLAVAPLPKMGEYVTHPLVDCPLVMTNSEHPEEAFAFANFLSDPENWIEDYKVGNSVPVVQEYLFGEKAEEWLSSDALPDGYREAIVNNLNYAGTNPELVNPRTVEVEWPAIMPHVMAILRGEVSAQEGMTAATQEANDLLQQQ